MLFPIYLNKHLLYDLTNNKFILYTKYGAIAYKNLTIVYSILNFNLGTSIPIFINVFLADVYVLFVPEFIF